MNKIQYKKLFQLKSLIFITAVFWAVTACNEEFPNLLKSDYSDKDAANLGNGRVLYIIVDGASGNAVRVSGAPNLAQVAKNALYTYNGLADLSSFPLTNATGWANQLTGVSADKHGVYTDDFAGNHLADYPSFISRLKAVNSHLRLAAFSASADFAGHFTTEADVNKTFEGDDQAVKDAAVEELNQEDPDLLLLQFHHVDQVGAATNYKDDNPDYKTAILQVDTYIGELLEALQGRPNYQAENWMVVISSNKGGTIDEEAVAGNAFDDSQRNIFTYFYSPRFSTKFIQQPILTDVNYSGFAPRYTYATNNYVNATLGDGSIYNFNPGNSGALTISFLIKNRTVGSVGWPTVLSKRASGFGGGGAGWNIYLKDTEWWINTSMSPELKGGTIADGKWHVVTTVFIRRNDSTITRLYTDGQFNSQDAKNWTSDRVDNDIPLRIGQIGGDSNTTPDVLITNLQIYNRAFSDDDISALSCLTQIDESHPYYSNLIGYWPCDEAGQQVLKERTGRMGSKANFRLSGPYTWSNFSDLSTGLCPPIPESFFRLVPGGTDIPLQILDWMGIQPEASWQLEGKGWSPTYSVIKP